MPRTRRSRPRRTVAGVVLLTAPAYARPHDGPALPAGCGVAELRAQGLVGARVIR
ncbi:hypothetical protein [Streptomyces millisiae]|uniref:Uncharacterized protein n=1 Tax=Streptomyces millisiae TaxID=3075542 RepID=A0ABU2LHV5_9ACTN|nr:hypothetical protein [Streptomyces sp. DSM 44918]MDT0316857.1 hypothetical protein [Streptomyces sp. DSM 44918]